MYIQDFAKPSWHVLVTNRQSTYNVTLRGLRATVVAGGSNKCYIYWMCFCSLRYAACNAREPNCPTSQYFSTFSHKRHSFRKKLENIKCVLILCTQLPETFFILRGTKRGLHVKYRLFMLDFNNSWIFLIHFRNILKEQFSWRSFRGEPLCSMRTDGLRNGQKGRRTDGYGEANGRFS